MRPTAGTTAITLAATMIVCLLLPNEAGAGRPEAPYRIVAGAYTKPAKDAPRPPLVTSSRTSLLGLKVDVEYADGARRAEFLRSIDPALRDPFATTPGGRERALTFIIAFANDAKNIAVFQPGNVAVVSDHDERLFPLDLSDMYMSAEHAGLDDLQEVLDRSSRVMFDSSTTIPVGGRMSRLLAFRPLEGKWRQIQVVFSFIQVGSETHTLSFTFHKEPIGD